MSSKNEVITLQFGHYSNFVGSHWWNLQEGNFVYQSDIIPEINYDVLYREGQNLRKEVTFTPRVLITDLKGSLKNLPQFSTLYEEPVLPDSVQLPWQPEKVQVEISKPFETNEFKEDLEKSDESIEGKVYNLDNKIEVWSDFLGAKFHPRTLTIINEYSHGDLEQPFESFAQGKQTWKDEIFQDTWVDNCRLYAEECDQLQGFQVLFDCYDAFSGLTCSAMQHLKDEYSQKCIISFPMISNFADRTQLKNTSRIVNIVLSMNELGEMSDMFVPLYTGNTGWTQVTQARQWPNITFNNDLWYHSSALLASFVDTIALNYRKRENISTMSNLCSALTGGGRTCIGGSLNVPFPKQANDSVLEILEKCDAPLWTSLTPNFEMNDHDIGSQNVVLRGVPKQFLFPKSPLKRNEMNEVWNCVSADEMLAMYMQYSYVGNMSRSVNTFSVPLKFASSFPHIFNSNITKFGYLSDINRSSDERVVEVAAIAGLHNTNSCRSILNSLHEEATTFDAKQCPMIRTSQLELLEYTEALENVLTHSESYE